jgi:hypothetical protein
MPTPDPIQRPSAAALVREHTISKYIRITMAVLLLVCLARMPYGYYQFVRFAAFAGFAILAFQYFNIHKITYAIFFGFLSLLFQPFFKVALGRTIWNVVDIIVAVILIMTLVTDAKAITKKN